MMSKMAAESLKFQLFAHQSSKMTNFDLLSIVSGLIWYIVYFTQTTVKIYVLKSKMTDQNGVKRRILKE